MLKQDRRVRYILIFKNYREAAGTSLAHSKPALFPNAIAPPLPESARKSLESWLVPDYNYVINSAPVADEDEDYYLWHIQIMPRLTSIAGFELGSGMRINVARPEDTARFMRETWHAH